ALPDQGEPVGFGGGLAGDRRALRIAGGKPGTLGIGTRRQALDARRIAIEPAGALGERLGMRTDALDSLERSAEAHQAMPHGDGYLAGDLERGLEQQVEGPTDGSFGRILDRDHPEIGVTRLGAAKDLVDRRAVEGLDAMAE